MSSMAKPLSWRIAEIVLAKFDELPQKCKPRVLPDGSREWTPLSAIILVHGDDQQSLTCVSLATGTKCLPASMIPPCQGSVVHDSHAEILALRAFNYWLLSELKKMLQKDEYASKILRFSSDIDSGHHHHGQDSSDDCLRPFQIKDDVSIHLFTTEAPCGDASMEILMRSIAPEDAVPWPVFDSDVRDDLTSLLGRGHFSILGAVRRKPSRADAQPSLSKSCTDKLALKQFLSVLSFPADLFVTKTPESFLKSIIVYSHQFDQISYSRAFSDKGRCASLAEFPAKFFNFDVLPPNFSRFKYEKIHLSPNAERPKQKASNVSAIWISECSHPESGVLEILLNGVKQGYQRLDARRQRESRLCRQQMWKLGTEVDMLLLNSKTEKTNLFSGWKSITATSYALAKTNPIRQQRNLLKILLVDKLGNWERNIGDDQWKLSLP